MDEPADEPAVADDPVIEQDEPVEGSTGESQPSSEAQGNDEPQAQQARPLDIRTQPGQGTTPDGAFWVVWLDDFTDERGAGVAAPAEGSDWPYEPQLFFRCSKDGTVLEVFFSDLPVSDINDSYSITLRWDAENPVTRYWAENGDRSVFLSRAVARRYVHEVEEQRRSTLRVRFEGYSNSVTTTFDVAELRHAPTWPNILACGN